MIKNILFDFDGVILDSMPVREYGFKKIFEQYDNTLVLELLAYHNKNGGLSRYVKIRYFFEKILKQNIKEEEVNALADQFSDIMKNELINKKYLIKETVAYIKSNQHMYTFHIVSGSDENELKFLCDKLNIAHHFKSIHGSPTHKNILVQNLLAQYNYNSQETILIGDSINDYEASNINNINFYGFNNLKLQQVSTNYIENFKDFVL